MRRYAGKYKMWMKYAAIAAVAVALARLLSPAGAESDGTHPRDYAEIRAEGTLRVTTEYNSVSFHVEGDTVAGLHYDLISAFARDHGLRLDLIPEMSFANQLRGLAEGRYDVIADGLPVTSQLRDSLLLTTPILLSRQVLVQRKAPADDTTRHLIRSHLELAGKTLHVVKGSPVILRIHNLGYEIGDTIYVREVERYGAEQLIAMVAHGDIDYAVCDADIARTAADSLPLIDISTAISFTQFYSWGVSKQSPALLDRLDAWLKRNRP